MLSSPLPLERYGYSTSSLVRLHILHRNEIPQSYRQPASKHISNANRKAAEAITKHSKAFVAFIDSKKSSVESFSKEITSFGSSSRVVKPYLPFTNDNGHKEYVEEKFAHYIFSKAELPAAMRLAIEGSIKDIEGIENELAVTLQQEILEWSSSLAQDEISIEVEQFKEAIGISIVSDLVAQVATRVTIRLGVSAGILTAGVANSPWSLGASFLIGFAVERVWSVFDDPQGDIEREMVALLDQLSEQASTVIDVEMNKVVSQRNQLWTKTIKGISP